MSEQKISPKYHLEMLTSKSRILRRKQYYSRIVVNGEVVWTGELVKNKVDCGNTLRRLSEHMINGSYIIIDKTNGK